MNKELRVHAVTTDSHRAGFLGLEFDMQSISVAVKPKKAVALRYAILELLRRRAASPLLLEIVLGHCASCALLRRKSWA